MSLEKLPRPSDWWRRNIKLCENPLSDLLVAIYNIMHHADMIMDACLASCGAADIANKAFKVEILLHIKSTAGTSDYASCP